MTTPVDETPPLLASNGWTTSVRDREDHNQKDEFRFAVTGQESQVLTIQLKNHRCQAEPGSIVYRSSGVRMSPTCSGCCARSCSGEDCCVVNISPAGSPDDAFVGLTPNQPTAKVVPVRMQDVQGKLIAQKGAYMASIGDVSVGISLDCNLMRCCCAGLGMIRQKLVGSGTVFLAATGTIVQKVLDEGETILVDTNCVLAFAGTCKLNIRRVGGLKVSPSCNYIYLPLFPASEI